MGGGNLRTSTRGRLEFGESMRAGAAREFQGETGLQVEVEAEHRYGDKQPRWLLAEELVAMPWPLPKVYHPPPPNIIPTLPRRQNR